MDNRDRIDAFVAAIQPLVRIADAYDANGLDEARPEWELRGLSGNRERARDAVERTILFSGRGGRELLTLGECFNARDAYRALKDMIAEVQPVAVPAEKPVEPRRRAITIG